MSPEEKAKTARQRRFQLGPGAIGGGWSPEISSSSGPEDDTDTDREIDQIVATLREGGELDRDELGEKVACKYWGPGRFRRALRLAADRGQIRRTGRRRYAPAE
jgi:hypothetical protein